MAWKKKDKPEPTDKPIRQVAKEMWLYHKGTIKNRQLSKDLGIPEGTIATWKMKDHWEDDLHEYLESLGPVKPKRKVLPPGTTGPPPMTAANKKDWHKNFGKRAGINGGSKRGNTNATAHGFLSKIFPQDSEIQRLLKEISVKQPIDILWENIIIQYLAILRSQKIMHVKSQDDLKKYLVKQGADFDEYELHTAWDRQAGFLNAQSKAMMTLEGMVNRFEQMMEKGMKNETQRVKIELLRAELNKLNNGGAGEASTQWISALEEVAEKRRSEGGSRRVIVEDA